MNENTYLTGIIIGKAIEVHRILGPGLLESTYKNCLCYELESAGLSVIIECGLPLIYKEIQLDCGYRIDLLVENSVVLELKTADAFTDVHQAQILTYMRLGGFKTGLLINFKVISLRNGGIKRFVL